MRRPAYTDALEYILEQRAHSLDQAAQFPRARHKIVERWELVRMTAELWGVEPATVAENVLRIHDLRALACDGCGIRAICHVDATGDRVLCGACCTRFGMTNTGELDERLWANRGQQ